MNCYYCNKETNGLPCKDSFHSFRYITQQNNIIWALTFYKTKTKYITFASNNTFNNPKIISVNNIDLIKSIKTFEDVQTLYNKLNIFK